MNRTTTAARAATVAAAALWLSAFGCGGGGAVDITTSSLSNGTVGVSYRATLEADGSGDIFWGFVSGRLPPGLALSKGGSLSGTPTGSGDFTFRVRAISTDGGTGEAELSLTVEEGDSSIILTTRVLPDGRVGEAYSQRVAAEGGLEPYSFGLASGSLPPGMNLSVAGLISGTPSDGVDTTLTIRIFDAGGGTGSGRLDLLVIGASGGPRFETDLLDFGRVGQVYDVTLEASGGQPPYTFTNLGRALPQGLELNEAGRISGTPEDAGVFELRFEVADARGHTGERSFLMALTPELILATSALPTGLVGDAYDETLDAEGGRAPYTFSIDQGALAEGLTLEANGRVHGTPVAGSVGTVRFRVADADGFAVEKTIPVRVYSFPIIEEFPGTALPGTCELEGEEAFVTEIPVATPGMIADLDVGVSITWDDLSYLTVALESPTGKRVVLFFGDLMAGGDDDGDGLDAFWDEEDEPATSLEAFRGEPTQGVWRLIVSVATSAWGECTAGGTIDHVFLALTTEPSSDPYVRISGWDTNNLVHYPGVRITGGGLDQHSVQFSVRSWSTGANGIAEGGTGDDVDMGEADLDWTTDLPAQVGTIDGSGRFTAGSETGLGTVTGRNGDREYTYDMAVVPPDWVP